MIQSADTIPGLEGLQEKPPAPKRAHEDDFGQSVTGAWLRVAPFSGFIYIFDCDKLMGMKEASRFRGQNQAREEARISSGGRKTERKGCGWGFEGCLNATGQRKRTDLEAASALRAWREAACRPLHTLD